MKSLEHEAQKNVNYLREQIKVLEKNVNDLQGQLQAAYIKIKDLSALK